jgi:hypothetical protein
MIDRRPSRSTLMNLLTPTIPKIVGTLGPQISTSKIPTSYFCDKYKASCVATVLLPTPPFPDKTSITCFIDSNFLLIN